MKEIGYQLSVKPSATKQVVAGAAGVVQGSWVPAAVFHTASFLGSVTANVQAAQSVELTFEFEQAAADTGAGAVNLPSSRATLIDSAGVMTPVQPEMTNGAITGYKLAIAGDGTEKVYLVKVDWTYMTFQTVDAYVSAKVTPVFTAANTDAVLVTPIWAMGPAETGHQA